MIYYVADYMPSWHHNFSLCENYNKGVIATYVPVVETFLFNIFLAVIIFSIANIETIVIGILGLLHILVFAFLVIKIVTQG